MSHYFIVVIYTFMALLPLAAQAQGEVLACPVVKIEAERLADLNIPRSGHMTLCVNGEPTVIGGHTINFVPTPTAEYYKDGAWHIVQLAYCHDDGCAVELSTGKVLVAGGHEKELGVGQTFMAEIYDPVTHTSEGFASLDTKRAMPAALALDSGRAVIAGNWHHTDAIEMYDGKKSFSPVKGVSVGRACPFILRTARDNAIILNSRDTVGGLITSPIADQLHGDPLHIPLLEQWRLLSGDLLIPSQAIFIGDETKEDYSYLLMVENNLGQLAIVRVTGEEFALLPTDVPIPMTCQWGSIKYHFPILADRQHQRAYILGVDADACGTTRANSRIYIVTIDYSMSPTHLTLCYTDEITNFDLCPILTGDGNLMLTGGHPTNNNFRPTTATWLLHVSTDSQEAGMGFPWWGWTLIVLAITSLTALLIMLSRRRKSNTPAMVPGEETQEVPDTVTDYTELMQRICQVMEEQQLFMNPDLKMTDLATVLGTNRSTISACINSQRGCSFPHFVNMYRVAYAQELLCSQPDIKIAEVCLKSGFSSEASFYRIFKAITGTTPNTWKTSL